MTSLPRFSVENPVLVNITMIAILLGGVYGAFTLVREMFPESRPNQIQIAAPFPGATPLEIEKGLAQPIEEAIRDLEHIDKVVTQITEGLCVVNVELTHEIDDLDQKVNELKAAIDAIPREEIPEDAEEIRVAKAEPRLPVISVTIFGEVGERELKRLGQRLKDELLLLPSVTDVVIGGLRKDELAVEVEPEKLIAYGLSLADVSDAIRGANLDLPGGLVKTARHNVAVRTLGETDDAERIAATVVRATPDGRLVRVSDVARVFDGFEDADTSGRFNHKPAVSATIYKTAAQDAIEIARNVRAFAAGQAGAPLELDFGTRLKSALGLKVAALEIYQRGLNDPLPPGVELRTHSNLARFIESRLELLTRNGAWGLLFVFASLLLFLNWRVALWVMAGLVLSVAGAIVMMHFVGATLNLISMFGLIVVLGLIVDDAIVVGENIYARVERGEDPRAAAVLGAQEVTWPVIVAISTTIGAFAPLLFIEGRIGDFMGVLPVIVMCALSVSLFEALTILPSHLAEWLRPPKPGPAPAADETTAAAARRVAHRHALLGTLSDGYERLLRVTSAYRYATVAAVLGLLLVTFGLVASGRAPFVFIPKMDSETLLADLDLPVGTPIERTRDAMAHIERAALGLQEIQTVWAIAGVQVDADEGGTYANERSHIAQVILELAPVEQRERHSAEIIQDLRRQTAGIPGVNSLRYRSMQGGPAGAEIEIEVTGEHMDDVLAASRVIQEKLAEYSGVYDVLDDYEEGRRELQIELLESARALGLSTRWLASEVRGAFYGYEPRTLQRQREDVDIRVRFAAARRAHLFELEQMRIATPAGAMVPLSEVARVVDTRGAASIRRVNQRRAVVVSADVEQSEGNAEQIAADMAPMIASLERQYRGLRIEFAGNKAETAKSFGSLKRDFVIALVVIYFMLAALFKSYVQPLVVLTAVPFGLIGAVLGHLAMGYPLTILSMIGLVALTGIVVNDSLILVDFVNKEIERGTAVFEAVIAAGLRRLRPILLTSLTTILGLAPLMTETSFQARFLIPMAISISFGLAFATLLTLIIIPANYLIVQDIKALGERLWRGPRSVPEPAQL